MLALNTLLPGTVRQEEADYDAHVLAATFAANNKPLPPPIMLHTSATLIGYNVLLDALQRSSKLLV